MITLLINSIKNKINTIKPVKNILTDLKTRQPEIFVQGPFGFFNACMLERIFRTTRNQLLIVTPTGKEAREIVSDLEHLDVDTTLFPWWGAMLYSGVSPQASVFGERVAALNAVLSGKSTIIVTPLRAFLGILPPPARFADNILRLKEGDTIDPVELEKQLAEFRYLRVPKATVRGEFALRGEVLDIVMPGMEEGIRIVFEFDTIENIKYYDPATQAALDQIPECRIYPRKEMVLMEDDISKLNDFLLKKDENAPVEGLLNSLEAEGEFRGEELYYSLCFDTKHTILDYLDEQALVVYSGKEVLQNGFEALLNESRNLFREKVRDRIPCLSPDMLFADYTQVYERTSQKLVLLSLKKNAGSSLKVHDIDCQKPRSFFGNIRFFKEELANLNKSGYEVFVCAGSESQASRIKYLVRDYDVEVIPTSISSGFTLPDARVSVIMENEIFGRRSRAQGTSKKVRSQMIESFVDLEPGDLVVHIKYGIGLFNGIDRITVSGNERDYICLEYAGNEKLFIPIEQVNLIQRYIGQDGRPPRLDKIGGKGWETRKSKARKSVEDLAGRLIALYSRRKKASGFSFPADDEWQIEFEASFPFQETPDQLVCIDEVKQDMESSRPMDRLICGDVGYGKTEIGMRAAFKAVMGGKQVAFLAPTTILVEQHFENFSERFERFPVEIGMLSRFITKAEQQKTLKSMREGELDIVIGTHRLLQKDVSFKNIGLMIVDEEQRFGVKAKEMLKELRKSVDCLVLSATPIPRTLHISLLKIRDLSVLKTPPHNRQPIETHIGAFDDELVAKAIRDEMQRGGQVFFLHNRVQTLDQVRGFLEDLVPEAFMETAHGKMSSKELEDVMHRFIHGSFHVLIATTIIENGIDIPNVNTIIIDRADMYGVSQLYQLRGRVGRSDKLAYAYLLYPEDRALTELAMKRLNIINDFTELGAGFKIAMKDMEVRGVGNLLGSQQSGDIMSVGFDMYLRLLDEAVSRLTEDDMNEDIEIYLELEYSGYVPDSYISEQTEKMEVYKKISAVTTQSELDGLFTELSGRFGPLPDEVHSLISLAEVRVICKQLSILSLREKNGLCRVEFGKVTKINPDKVMRLIQESNGRVKLDPKTPNILILKTDQVGLKEKSEFLTQRLGVLV